MDALISLAGVLAIVGLVGLLLGWRERKHFRPAWLLAGLVLIAINDLALTNLFGSLPNLFAGSGWNWQGKLLALLLTLAIAALPQFGWKRIGLSLKQRPGSLKTALPVSALYLAFFVAIALAFPSEAASAETIAFQLTMPSLEEELFYRGLLLFAFVQAFAGGKDTRTGALISAGLLSSIAFGLAHAFSHSSNGFALEPIYFFATFIPSLLAVWIRLRTGSLLLPVLLHSAGNTLPLVL